TLVLSVRGGEYCRAAYYGYYMYCPVSCCGSYYNKYCCDHNWSGGTIAGLVIGCIVGLGLLITVLVCLCAACNKNRHTRGRVVYPSNQQPTVAIVNTNTHTGHGSAYPQQGTIQPHPPFPPQGPAYPPQGPANPPQGPAYPPPPPGYNPQGPVYPPPPPAYNPQGPAYPPSNTGQFVPPPKYSAT
ncbi:extensin-like, partial [Mizuhopecten yessoensis]|uniref:extensin-like n=1 Tax=Mizuhopecten yessoensis TaxID=6573 RepID=UPI000B45B2A2